MVVGRSTRSLDVTESAVINTEECPSCGGVVVPRYPFSAAWLLIYFFCVVGAFVGALFISKPFALVVVIVGLMSWFWGIRQMERAAKYKCLGCGGVFSFGAWREVGQ